MAAILTVRSLHVATTLRPWSLSSWNSTDVRWPTQLSLRIVRLQERAAAERWTSAVFDLPSNEHKPYPSRQRTHPVQEPQNSGGHPPNQRDRVSAAWQQLNLVLGFFSRVDTKLSVGLGINLGMLAMIATRLPKLDELTALISVVGVLFLTPLTVSFWHLWYGYFPELRGGSNSLIFFERVSSMAEHEFLQKCAERTLMEFEEDLLGQCWRNSKILSSKFSCLKYAYIATVLAIAPWMALIVVLPPPAK
ncbi:hypothetical protein I5U77_07740 [Stenotrophomonas maltophilia]|nr:hypothetical protein [Stenotrophomonas maltophilia]